MVQDLGLMWCNSCWGLANGPRPISHCTNPRLAQRETVGSSLRGHCYAADVRRSHTMPRSKVYCQNTKHERQARGKQV